MLLANSCSVSSSAPEFTGAGRTLKGNWWQVERSTGQARSKGVSTKHICQSCISSWNYVEGFPTLSCHYGQLFACQLWRWSKSSLGTKCLTSIGGRVMNVWYWYYNWEIRTPQTKLVWTVTNTGTMRNFENIARKQNSKNNNKKHRTLLSTSSCSLLVLLSFVGSTVLAVVALLHHQLLHPGWWIHQNRWVKLLLQFLE